MKCRIVSENLQLRVEFWLLSCGAGVVSITYRSGGRYEHNVASHGVGFPEGGRTFYIAGENDKTEFTAVVKLTPENDVEKAALSESCYSQRDKNTETFVFIRTWPKSMSSDRVTQFQNYDDGDE